MRAVPRPHPRLQGHGDAAARRAVRPRPRGDRVRPHRARGDLGRHRVERRARLPGERPCRRLHAVAAGTDVPVPSGADVHGRRPQHPQPGGARRLRPVPGAGQAGDRRRRLQGGAPYRGGQLDQLGPGRGPGGLLRVRLAAGGRRRTGRSRSPCRPATSATSTPATWPGGWGRRSAGWWWPPTRTTSSANSSPPARYRPRRPEDVHATSSPSMDIARASNLERYVFDLLDGDAAAVADLFGRAGRVRAGRDRRRRSPPPGSSPAARPTPTGSPPSGPPGSVGGSPSIRTPPTGSPWGAGSSSAGCP